MLPTFTSSEIKLFKLPIKIFTFTFMLLLVSCATKQRLKKYPDINKANAKFSIAIIEVSSYWYLDELPQCKQPNLCLDPPPIALKANVIDVVAGKVLPKAITIATTDHYGGLSYELYPKRQQWLVKVMSYNSSYLMPRYAKSPIISSTKDEKFVDISSDKVWWLPCLNNPPVVEHFDWVVPQTQEIEPTKGIKLSLIQSELLNKSYKLSEGCRK